MFRTIAEPTGNLVGWFVLTPNESDGPRGHQGQIVEILPDDLCLVQWFSWLDGEPTKADLFSVSQMHVWNWSFYAKHADWIHAGRELTFGRKYARAETESEFNFCQDHGYFGERGCSACQAAP